MNLLSLYPSICHMLIPILLQRLEKKVVHCAYFLKASKTFWAHKAIFSSSVSKNVGMTMFMYMPEKSCMKETFDHIISVSKNFSGLQQKNMHLCSHCQSFFGTSSLMLLWKSNFFHYPISVSTLDGKYPKIADLVYCLYNTNTREYFVML